jgi:alcohol dehydrogenase class IV
MARILMPRQLNIGGGALSSLPSVLQSLGAQRPLILTDQHVEKAGIIDKVKQVS